ncbi:MAG: hypothetical protein IID14_05925 [Candidatus Marinimicrobia bacterium]|nr:hypothetical protein [Candidatus Neomarinimicrobiota bacterium]
MDIQLDFPISKHALNGFFASLRTELVGSCVQITVVCPSFVQTDIRLHGFNGDGQQPAEDPFDDGKVMTAEEAAASSSRWPNRENARRS